MDARTNPYSPGAGLRPRILAGRENDIENFDVLADRAGAGLTSQSIVFTGLRGVGKTVLLHELAADAERRDWITARVEADRNDDRSTFRNDVARGLSTSLRLVRGERAGGSRFKAALRTFKSFTLSVTQAGGYSFGVEVDPEQGRADTGELYTDLTDLAIDLGGAAADIGVGVAVFVDEMQDLSKPEMSAICRACHEAGQRSIPFFVIGAGLPNLPGQLAEAESYAERLFEYRTIDRLAPPSAQEALVGPSRERGVDWMPEAASLVEEASNGYPYFIQQFGKTIWDAAPVSPITDVDARNGIVVGLEQLDRGFFTARWNRATPVERDYLAAMATDGPGPSSSGTVASRLGKSTSQLGPTRASLIGKGIIYAPEYGVVAFTVPGMADFIARQHG